MYVCWSVKGGSGTSVVACALAVVLGRERGAGTIVDACGDAPAILGMPEPTGLGIHDWLRQRGDERMDIDALRQRCTDSVDLIARGTAQGDGWGALVGEVDASTTVCDFGTQRPPGAIVDDARADLLVVRACYLALRRAARLERPPTGVVLIEEPGRALVARDVEVVVRAPVVARVPFDERIARTVDAGLLSTRLPDALAGALSAVL
jgi:hypothetical protein